MYSSSDFHTPPHLIQIILYTYTTYIFHLERTCEAIVEVDTASRAIMEHVTTDNVRSRHCLEVPGKGWEKERMRRSEGEGEGEGENEREGCEKIIHS